MSDASIAPRAKLVEWHDPKVKLPEDGEECLLLPPDPGGIVTNRVYGPIAWHANSSAWLDLFASPEAGEIIRPDLVALWTPWFPIAPASEEDGCPNDPP